MVLALPTVNAVPLIPERERVTALLQVIYPARAVVGAVYAREAINDRTLMAHTGFTVEHGSDTDMALTACTLLNVKWRYPRTERMVVLRTFWGPEPTPALWTDEQLLAKHHEAMTQILHIETPPRFVSLRRWPFALPYIPGGPIRSRIIPNRPGLYLVGPLVGGVGLSDCVKTAWDVAEEITQDRSSHIGTKV